MASKETFVAFVCDQLQGVGAIRSRKMFGDFMIYVNDKPLLLLCDDTVFVKKLPALAELLRNAPCGVPYEGSKEHYILDPEDTELLRKTVEIMEPLTPLPRARKAKKG